MEIQDHHINSKLFHLPVMFQEFHLVYQLLLLHK